MQILQLSEAVGWQAVYASAPSKPSETPEAELALLPVACWALIEEAWDDGETPAARVVGMVPDGEDLEPAPCRGFLGYLGPGQDAQDYAQASDEFWRTQAEDVSDSIASGEN